MAGFLVLASCSSYEPEVRYRLTFSFTEAGHLYSGTSVIEARPRIDQTIDGNFYNDDERGEAPFVRLREGQLVVMLLRRWPVQGGRDPLPYLQGRSGVIRLSQEQLPQMVWFQRPGDPGSLAFVWPDAADKTLGHGIHFVDASIQRDASPITHGIKRVLPWLRFWPRGDDLKTRQRMCFPQNSCVWRENLIEGD
jgi:hypothetical protein